MKKLLLVLSLVILNSAFNAQDLILTKASYEPIIGDTSRHYIVDTSNYSTGLNAGLTGANTLWVYGNLLASGNILESAYVDPSSVANATAYAGCTIVQKQGALNSYYKSVTSPSTQIEFQGVSSSSLNMNFTNTAVYNRWPIAFSNVVTDSYSGSFTFSFTGAANGNATVTADGTGTLILPNGVTFNNVLRVKSSQTTNFAVTFPPISGSMKQTVYSWYHASQKFPILSFNYQTIAITGAGSPTITAQVLGNKNNFVIGLNEYGLNEVNATLYPNPANDVLNISTDVLNPVKEVKIFNQLGEIVLVSELQNSMNVSGLSKGIYLAEIKTTNGIARKKIIKE